MWCTYISKRWYLNSLSSLIYYYVCIKVHNIYIATESVTWQLVSRYAPVHCRNIPYSRFACWKTHDGTENSRLPHIFRREFQRPTCVHSSGTPLLFVLQTKYVNIRTTVHNARARWNPNTIRHVQCITFYMQGKRFSIATGKKKICEIRFLYMQTSAAMEKDIRIKKNNHTIVFGKSYSGLFRVPTNIHAFLGNMQKKLCSHESWYG